MTPTESRHQEEVETIMFGVQFALEDGFDPDYYTSNKEAYVAAVHLAKLARNHKALEEIGRQIVKTLAHWYDPEAHHYDID